MPECPSTLRVLECWSAWVPKSFEFPSPKAPFECPIASSAQVPESSVCPWSTLGVLFQCSGALWVPLESPLSALQVKKVCNIIWNCFLNSFIEFFETFSEYIFYIILIVFCFLGNKMCKFYHVLLTRYRYNHSKRFQTLSLNIF